MTPTLTPKVHFNLQDKQNIFKHIVSHNYAFINHFVTYILNIYLTIYIYLLINTTHLSILVIQYFFLNKNKSAPAFSQLFSSESSLRILWAFLFHYKSILRQLSYLYHSSGFIHSVNIWVPLKWYGTHTHE